MLALPSQAAACSCCLITMYSKSLTRGLACSKRSVFMGWTKHLMALVCVILELSLTSPDVKRAASLLRKVYEL